MKLKKIMIRSYTDPDLYQAMCFKSFVYKIPKVCNRQLIDDYLKKLSIENLRFSILDNKLQLRCPKSVISQKELKELVEYIEVGEQLINIDTIEVFVKREVLPVIVVVSLFTIVLCIFVPSVAIFLTTFVPSLLMTGCISSILFCFMSVPEYLETSINNKFRVCEEKLSCYILGPQENSLSLPSLPLASNESHENQAEAMPSTSSSNAFFSHPSNYPRSDNIPSSDVEFKFSSAKV